MINSQILLIHYIPYNKDDTYNNIRLINNIRKYNLRIGTEINS